MNCNWICLLLLFCIGCVCPEPQEVKFHPAKKEFSRKNIVVSIGSNQQFYLGSTKVDSTILDSVLLFEINKIRTIADTPTVVINADTTTWYGQVFRVMTIAKRAGAKVVANVK
jgi:biopolymer transport protein ExbD